MDGIVGYATGEAKEPPLRPVFDRRIKLEFHGARISSDGGLLAYRELDDALGLTEIAITQLLDGRRGKNARHTLGGLLRQSVFGRLAGYEDVNDAERLARDPAMRAIVGREGLERLAASSSQIGRFETEWLANCGLGVCGQRQCQPRAHAGDLLDCRAALAIQCRSSASLMRSCLRQR
jgi:hypothetical protein